MRLLDALAEPFHLGLFQRAVLEVVLVGLLGGLVGGFVVVRGSAFIGETLSHTVLPGVAIAYVLGVSLYLGAAAFAALTVALVLVVGRGRHLADDTAIGIAFAGLFPLGVIVVARQSGVARSLDELLFGDPFATTRADLLVTAGVGAGLLALVVAGYRPLLAASYDRPFAQALGYRVGLVDAVLLAAVAAAVVVAMLAIGNVLSLALVVTPAAAARLMTRRLVPLLVLGALLGALAGVVALELSYWLDLAAGACVVLCATAELVLAAVLGGAVRRRGAAGPAVPAILSID